MDGKSSQGMGTVISGDGTEIAFKLCLSIPGVHSEHTTPILQRHPSVFSLLEHHLSMMLMNMIRRLTLDAYTDR